MKELSTEEKAKAYDKALEKAQKWYDANTNEGYRGIFGDIFPKLKESEDERIRTKLLNLLKELLELGGVAQDTWSMTDCEQFIAWLEKQVQKPQGKSALEAIKEEKVDNANKVEPKDYGSIDPHFFKYADKIEPKFHEGEWITNGYYTWKIVEVKPLDYILQSQDGNVVDDTRSYVDEKFHSFTIEDAKDGDVLADGNLPFIFKNIDANKYSYAYCGISVVDGFTIESDGESGEWTWMQDIKPATKEQRDLLFQKMKEAGYEWDAEKKELKKMEQKPVITIPKFKIGDKIQYSKGCGTIMTIEKIENGEYIFDNNMGRTTIENGNEWNLVNLVEEKPAWSEEDDKMINSIAVHLNATTCGFPEERAWADRFMNWLKSLKDRVLSQPKQEWNEEDKTMIESIIDYMQPMPIFFESTTGKSGKEYTKKFIKDATKWLKSLRPQSTWKPSDEQIKVCKEVYADILSAKGFNLGTVNDELNRLEAELKKLKG